MPPTGMVAQEYQPQQWTKFIIYPRTMFVVLILVHAEANYLVT